MTALLVVELYCSVCSVSYPSHVKGSPDAMCVETASGLWAVPYALRRGSVWNIMTLCGCSWCHWTKWWKDDELRDSNSQLKHHKNDLLCVLKETLYTQSLNCWKPNTVPSCTWRSHNARWTPSLARCLLLQWGHRLRKRPSKLGWGHVGRSWWSWRHWD